MKYKIIIWGLGGVYNRHLNIIKYFEAIESFQVIALTANNLPDIKFLDGYRVVPVTVIQSLEYDYIMVMNDVHFEDIVKTALENGVSREQILTYQILEIPNLNFNEYIRLKESCLSIISNNCWGGIVYKNLGMECLSPFKNLFIEDDDYIRLLTNLKGYLEEKIQFSHYAIDEHSKKKYPVMKIGDISIHCNHDDNPETAVRNWERRCVKINYDNLFIEMYTESPEVADQFQAMEQFEKRICFVPFESKKKNVFQLELHGRQTEFWEAVNSNAGNGNNCFTFDLVINYGTQIQKYAVEGEICMDSQVEISVLIPVYNVERYLEQCLESIVNQTMKNIEIICINDGSTDGSGKILDKYACIDSRIRVIHKKNTGYGHSMNVGINSAQGNYISILESDDFAETDMLECLYRHAVSSRADVVKANFYNYFNGKDERNERLAQYPLYQTISYKNCPALMKIADSIWSALYKKEFLIKNNILFNETPGASFQDTSFAAICWLFAEKVYLINDAVLHYRMDNIESSIHASGKIFCICDEWKRVENILDKYPEKKEILKEYEIAMKYQGYLFNYFRLGACYQYALLVRIQEELLKDEEQGFLEKKCFEPVVWDQVTEIIADREQFFIKTAKAMQDERMEKAKTKNKEVYYKAFLNEIRKYPSVIIYGAGRIGREVADTFQKENIRITCFAVSDINDNSNVYMGITVEPILSLTRYTEESAVIVAVGDRHQYEIYNILKHHKFKNIFLMDRILRDCLQK